MLTTTILTLALWFAIAVLLAWVVDVFYGSMDTATHGGYPWWRLLIWFWPITLVVGSGLVVYATYLWARARRMSSSAA